MGVTMNDVTKKYGLLTAVTMIVGICIGSGIFFKSDNILIATGGSIAMGIALFAVAAICIIFGGLTISELASRTEEMGGLISYAEVFVSKSAGCGIGWFQMLVYYPSITAVVAWVVGVYTCILFNLGNSLSLQLGIGYAFLCLCFLYNLFLPRFGAVVQNGTTFIKLIPLFLLGILGFALGDPINGLAQTNPSTLTGVGFLTALGPIAYSFDGWIVATAISHELKSAKKNMPRALLIGPLVVLFIYALYFGGISVYVGPQQVMELGDAHVSVAAQQLLGTWFSKAVVIFVIISVIGTVNGLVTGYIRMPYALAIRPGMMPFAHVFGRLNNHQMPGWSALLAWGITTLWTGIHYLCTRFDLIPNSDVSEGAIIISYIFYALLYYQVFKMYRQGVIKSIFKGVVCPLFATMGSLVILSGGLQSSFFWGYLVFCLAISLGAVAYYRHSCKQ